MIVSTTMDRRNKLHPLSLYMKDLILIIESYDVYR